MVLAFALDATPDELVAGVGTACPGGDVAANLARLWPERDHVLSTKRVRIRGPAAPDPANRNPGLEGIAAWAIALDPACATTVAPGAVSLTPVLPAGAAGEPEVYTKLDAAGAPHRDRAGGVGLLVVLDGRGPRGPAHPQRDRPGEVDGRRGGVRARVAVVVRDLRGGTAWAVRDVVVAR